MTPDSLAAIVAAIIGASVGFVAIWQGRKQRRELEARQSMKVDAEAYERAQGIYEASLTEMQARLTRLLDTLQRSETRNVLLEMELTSLRDYVNVIRELMGEAGMKPPPIPPRPVLP